MKKIAFICTGNSCRSQMAEGFAHKLLGEKWEVYSAGVSPLGKIQPLTYDVMKEVGIDISLQYSKGLEEIPMKEVDYFITLCGSAKDHCPVLSSHIKKEHWPIEDPFQWSSDTEKLLNKYREARDDIKKRIERFIKKCQPL
ncbi:MAG TPA: arsenate reductase ArsC [Bdellovibrionota bacterium]|nr:arsenate reductase ArsC [Bdellovibrionota bacterium]